MQKSKKLVRRVVHEMDAFPAKSEDEDCEAGEQDGQKQVFHVDLAAFCKLFTLAVLNSQKSNIAQCNMNPMHATWVFSMAEKGRPGPLGTMPWNPS